MDVIESNNRSLFCTYKLLLNVIVTIMLITIAKSYSNISFYREILIYCYVYESEKNINEFQQTQIKKFIAEEHTCTKINIFEQRYNLACHRIINNLKCVTSTCPEAAGWKCSFVWNFEALG